MKLTTKEIEFIQGVISTAKLVDIESVIIEPGKIRGIDENHTVVMFQDNGVMDMSFGSIGLNRLDTFNSRLVLVKDQPKFEVEAITVGEDVNIGFDVYDSNIHKKPPMWIRSINMKANKTKIEFRGASPQTIRAPKERSGVARYKIDINPELVNMIQKGQSAMKTKDVTFKGNENGVLMIISDDNGDNLEYKFTDFIHSLDGSNVPSFSYTYPTNLVLSIFKTNPAGFFSLTARGSLIFEVNNIDIFVLAKSSS